MNLPQSQLPRSRRLDPLQQYWSVVRFAIQNTVVYRFNFFVQAAFNLIPVFTGLALWRTIYADGRVSVAGYTAVQMLSYYLLGAVVDALTGTTEEDWQIAGEIKEGHVNQFLVKPLDYLHYRLCMFISSRLVFSMAAVVPVGVFLVLNSDALIAPPGLWGVLAFGLALVCSAINQFLLTFLTATLAFWILEVSAFTFVLLAFERLAGGLMFPLDILPVGIQHALALTPFACQVYIPIEIYLGRIHGSGILLALGLELFWVAVLWLAARAVWNRGIRAYSAYGG